MNLHLVVTSTELSDKIIAEQKPFAELEVIDMEKTDYSEIVEKIFAADSVAVWS